MKKNLIILILLLPVVLNAQQQITITGNMKLHPGTSMTVFGNFKNDGSFIDSGQVVSFAGTTNQVISGTSITQLKNYTVNNSTGVLLNQSLIILNSINLINGAVNLNSNTIEINSGLTSAVARTNGFFVSEQTNNSSKVKWNIGTVQGAHIFPFGVISGEYIPFTFNLTAGNIGNVTISTYNTNPSNIPFPVTPNLVTHVNNTSGVDNSVNVVDRFWQIDKDGPNGTATLTFTAQASEVGTITNLQAQRWNIITQSWDSPLPGQVNSSNTASVPNVTNFSPWTLSGNNTPLYFELVTFTATANHFRQVDVNWSTSSEINNDYFTIERTLDGINYEFVALVDGAGNSNKVVNYYCLDPDPYEGISYYRLKQMDYDGHIYYSKLVSVNLTAGDGFSASTSPNPSDGNFSIAISEAKGEKMLITVSDIMGKTWYYEMVDIPNNYFVYPIAITPLLNTGTYSIIVSNNKYLYTCKLIVN